MDEAAVTGVSLALPELTAWTLCDLLAWGSLPAHLPHFEVNKEGKERELIG